MTDDEKKTLQADPDGLLTYEYIANHIGQPEMDLPWLVDNMIRTDGKGQFTASAARYLSAIDPKGYAAEISELISATIHKDREHSYPPSCAAFTVPTTANMSKNSPLPTTTSAVSTNGCIPPP